MHEVNAELVCGVDEAGRGPLAGPVYAAAVILRSDHTIMGLADSKALSALQRERLSEEIRANALAWAVAFATVEEIDRLNILQASLLAMRRAVAALSVRPVKALVDGNRDPRLDCLTETIVKGDATVPVISAASILAKVDRDTEMLRLHALHPAYGLDQHKGYPTKQHLAAIRQHGVCEIHRRSFAPVRRVLQEGTGG
jgi:ribonuclease HII